MDVREGDFQKIIICIESEGLGANFLLQFHLLRYFP